MKKGSISPIIAIILGLAAILIVLFVFGQPLYAHVKSVFKEKGVLDVLPEEGQQGGSGVPIIKISGAKEDVVNKLVEVLSACWDSRPSDAYLCAIVDLGPGSRVELDDVLSKVKVNNPSLSNSIWYYNQPRFPLMPGVYEVCTKKESYPRDSILIYPRGTRLCR